MFNNRAGQHGGFADPAGGAAIIGGGSIRPPEPLVVWTLGFEGVLSQSLFANTGNNAPYTSLGWGTANAGRLFPWVNSEQITARKLFWWVGGGNTGNADVAIYDATLARVVSTGSTALGTINTLTEVDIADTPLSPGLYYLAIALDNAAGFVTGIVTNQTPDESASLGALTLSTFPLPASAAAATRWDSGIANPNVIPGFGLSQRTLVV